MKTLLILLHTRYARYVRNLKTLIACLLFLCIFTGALPVYAQKDEMAFEHISLEHELSDSVVTCIIQDKQGFLWIGTENGLNRYDGYTFTTYRHDPKDPQSLSSNDVKIVYEDHLGVLWVGTEDGLQTYNWETDQFIHYSADSDDPNSLKSNEILEIYEDQKGVVWIGTDEGLHSYDRSNNQFIRYGSDTEEAEDDDEDDDEANSEKIDDDDNEDEVVDNEEADNEDVGEFAGDAAIETIYQDPSGMLWFGTDQELYKYDGETFTLYAHELEPPDSLVHNLIVGLYEDRLGNRWFRAWNEGLLRCNQHDEQCIHYRYIPDDPGSLSHDDVNVMYEDQTGVLWVGTLNGLNKFDRESERFIRYQHDPTKPHSLSYNEIGAIFEDRAGVLWIGTDGGGLNKFNRRTEHFLHYQHHPNNPWSLSHNRVQAFYEDRSGTLWIGTEVGGLNRLNRDTEQFIHYRHDPDDPYSLSSDEVTALYEDSTGTLWVGTDEGGLDRFDREIGQFTHYLPDPDDPHSISHDIILVVYEDREGVLWIGTEDGGLNRFHRETETFTVYQSDEDDPTSLSGDKVWTIREDRDGVLWIGTDEGLNRFDRETGGFYRYETDPENLKSLSHNTVWSIYEDSAGVLWIGTGGGLNKFDRENEMFTHYTEQDGLPHEVIYGILEDETGHLWLSTGNGLSRFDPKTDTFKNYGINELQNITFMEGAYHKSRSGEMFFGGMQGFNAFYPEKIQDNPSRPPVVITDFSIFNRSVPIGEDTDGRMILKTSITQIQEITLSYKDSVFSFEFAALDYTIPEKNQYAYMMEGFDQEWNEIGTRRTATYTNLPAGTYTFRIKGSNNDGVWNEEGAALRITITPPFWETAWFRGLLAVCIIGAAYGVHKFRIRQMKAYQERLEYEVQERTKELIEKNQQIRQQQRQLIESEKMAALGQLVTSVAHEINTPLGAIRASIGNISHALSKTVQQLPQLFQQLSPKPQADFFALVERALQSNKRLTSREERKLRRTLEQELEGYNVEHAHDIADMLVDIGIYENITPFVPLFQQDHNTAILQAAYNLATQHHNSDNITTAVDRASKIVFALKSYARHSDSGEMSGTNISESIEVVLTLYHNQLKRGIEIIKHYEDVPSILCYPDELNQVWTNLIHNAIQAMEGKGKLEITVTEHPPAPLKGGIVQSSYEKSPLEEHPPESPLKGGRGVSSFILVQITDSGHGIPDEIKDQIFEPFFTTRPSGEGSGLGLDICRKIIDKHQGKIDFESQPGKTTFSVLLPMTADENLL